MKDIEISKRKNLIIMKVSIAYGGKLKIFGMTIIQE